jgi:hypothetical protein
MRSRLHPLPSLVTATLLLAATSCSNSGDRDIIPDPPRQSSPSSNRNTVPYTPPYIASPSGD